MKRISATLLVVAAALSHALGDTPLLPIRVNEVMASNGTTLLAADGSAPDWVELYNPNDQSVDISGWRLSDKTGEKAWSKGQPLPEGSVVPANGYLVVFADSYTGWTNGEIHVDIGFSNDGEAVTLSSDADTVISSFEFPAQVKDVSYGYGSARDVLVASTAAAEYRVGTSGAWKSAQGGLGFCSQSGAFTCTQYNINASVDNLDHALAYVRDRTKWRSNPATGTYQTISFGDNSDGDFEHVAFPGNSSTSQGIDNFVVVSTGAIYIPEPGLWSFCVGSDDGFRLRIAGHGQTFSTEFTTGRGHGHTLATFNFPEAGAYDVELVFFENGGGADCEFSAAPGSPENFSTGLFHLVGANECEIRHAGAFAPYIAQNIGDEMRHVSDTLEWRTSFDFSRTPAVGDALALTLRYVDGFVATLNGVEVARDNAPPTTSRNALGAEPVTFAIPLGLLQQGTNTLAITAYNDAVADPDFILAPELAYIPGEESLAYFKTPTPGAANTTRAYGPMTPPVAFSEPHGYKTAPFDLALSCPDAPSAAIYYTLDGTSPSVASGTLYTAPLRIAATTVVRAAIPDAESILQVDSTASYLFLDDILRQDTNAPAGFPASGAVNNHTMRYGMLQEIVNGADAARVLEGFTNSICTLSIVTDPAHLFHPQTGIYVNPNNDGRGWERPVHVEQIDPVNGTVNEFQIPAGIRIRGAYSRGSGYAKHSLRLFFRSEYGAGSLKFPLFGDEGAGEFEKVDLRCSQNDSYYQGSANDTLIHELFSRDTQRDMGQPYTRTRYYNLFLNGVYWGVYQTQERGDADYAATYLGGDSDDWDCIKTTQPGYYTAASDGTMDAFNALWDIAVNEGFGADHPDNYRRVLGLNPDGSRNPAYPVYVNPTNLMDFMIDVHFAVDNDSPAAGGMPNNMYGLRDRTDASTGFVWLRHDAEHSLRFGGGASSDSLLWGTEAANTVFRNQSAFNPAELHYRLLENDEYRRVFADRIQQHCFGDGALTPDRAAARFRARMAEIDSAVVCELARWGNVSWSHDTWINSCNECLSFITRRTPYLVQHYRAHGWFPALDAPTASRYSGELAEDESFVLAATNLFYYTTDGSDPRAADGTPNPAATVADAPASSLPLVARNGLWSYYDWGNEPTASNGARWYEPAYDASSWPSGNGVFGFAGANGTNPIGCQTHRFVDHGSSGTQVMTTYFRRTVTLPAGSGAEGVVKLVGTVLFDDGYALYLNGVKIHRDNLDDNATYSTGCNTIGDPDQTTYFAREIAIPAGLLHDGDNILAVELHQCHGSSTDLYFDLALDAVVTAHATVAVDSDGTRVLARCYNAASGEWSALTEALVSAPATELAPAAEAVRVAEILSMSADGGGDGSEYIVLTNVCDTLATSLADLRLTCAKSGSAPSLDIVLPAIRLAAGASVTLTKAAYWPAAKITNGKVDGVLYDADGTTPIQTFYIDASWWNEACKGTGASFLALDLGPEVTGQLQWRPSFASALAGNLAVAEVMSSTPDAKGDGREYVVLTNLSTTAKLDLAGSRLTFTKTDSADPSCDIVLPADTSLAKGGALVLRREDFADAGWTKITNGKVDGALYDAAGTIRQTLHFEASWWNKACDGTGASFLALDFGPEVIAQTQWRPSFLLPTDAAGLAAVKEAACDEPTRLWLAGLGTPPDGTAQVALSAFAGSAADLGLCRLLGILPETAPDVDLTLSGIAFDPASGTLSLNGALLVDGAAHTGTLNGAVKLVRSATLDGPATTNVLDATAFPLRVEGLPAEGDSAFYRLLVE